jgi:putative FmdB family regulatory protein
VPTYQYACTACDERLEVAQKFTDDPLTECDVCGGRLRKVFSPVGIVFKGSGFYRTDSRNGSGPGKDAKQTGKDAKQNGADGGSTEGAAPATGGGDSKAAGDAKLPKTAETKAAARGPAATKAA